MKKILCFGDSNVYGEKPLDELELPLLSENRWTNLLANNLGDNYLIISDGLSGRTLCANEEKDYRRGFTVFQSCIRSNSPVDLVLLMLGTNDVKTRFNLNTKEIASYLNKYIDEVRMVEKSFNLNTKILVIAPAVIDPKVVPVSWGYNKLSEDKSVSLVHDMEIVCKESEVYFSIVMLAQKYQHLMGCI